MREHLAWSMNSHAVQSQQFKLSSQTCRSDQLPCPHCCVCQSWYRYPLRLSSGNLGVTPWTFSPTHQPTKPVSHRVQLILPPILNRRLLPVFPGLLQQHVSGSPNLTSNPHSAPSIRQLHWSQWEANPQLSVFWRLGFCAIAWCKKDPSELGCSCTSSLTSCCTSHFQLWTFQLFVVACPHHTSSCFPAFAHASFT